MAQLPSGEYRALWVDAWGPGFLNPDQTTDLVENARKYHFNALFVQMRRRGDAFYMPAAPNREPRTAAVAPDYDVLADLIAKAHAGSPRLEVHCWIPANLVWSSRTAPTDPEHVVNRHPEFLMKNSAGETHMAEGKYLDPGHPGAMLWNLNLARDIASRYPIDGFHWDYIRYPQQDSGYNELALQRYQSEFSTTTKPSPSDPRFSAWRRRQVTDFLRWANSELLAIKPNLILSAAVFANRSDAFNHRFQDWAAWNREGIIDLCIPMNYTSDLAGVFTPRLEDAASQQGIRWVLMGIGAYLNTKENSLSQLQLSRSKGLPGSVVYSYRTPNAGTVNPSTTFDYIKAKHQPSWIQPPALPWKTSKSIVKGTIRASDTGQPIYNATVALQTDAARTQRTEPHGTFAFFDVPAGPAQVTVSAPGFAPATIAVQAQPGLVAHTHLLLTNAFDMPVVITRIVPDARGTLTLHATGPKEIRYALEESINLRDWTELTNTIATSSTIMFTTPAPGHRSRFYRIQQLR